MKALKQTEEANVLEIVDTFVYDNKTAIYCTANKAFNKTLQEITIENNKYKVIKQDIMKSLMGDVSVTFLLDTNEQIEIGKKVII